MKVLICSVLFTVLLQAQALKIGDPAPDFTLPYATKDSVARSPVRLSDEIGRTNIIIAFYPADWSPGCTREVCSFRDNFTTLQTLGAEVLAISGDYPWSHHEWAKFHNLSFKLLSDHKHQVAAAYQSYDGSSPCDRRTVFVIDRHGTIAYMNLSYSVADEQDFVRLKNALSRLR